MRNINKANQNRTQSEVTTNADRGMWDESRRATAPTFAGSKERLDREKSPEEASIDSIHNLLSLEELNPAQHFQTLKTYAQARKECIGVKKPHNLFFALRIFRGDS